jgi:methylamine utilization protein MauE
VTDGRAPFDLPAVVLRAGSALLGAMWVVAAASKAAHPESAYEFTTRLVGGGDAAKVLVTFVATGEALLGVLMLLGGLRGLAVTFFALLAATGALAWVSSTAGGKVHCGCLALLADSSVDEALSRNTWLVGGVSALLALAWLTRPRGPGAAAASGPSTRAP